MVSKLHLGYTEIQVLQVAILVDFEIMVQRFIGFCRIKWIDNSITD